MKATTALTAAAALVVLNRLKDKPTRAGTSSKHDEIEMLPTVSVVVPARNEAERIGPCISALSDMAVHELIVVDDESTDETALIALRYGATVISAGPRPDDWVGKPWAMQRGLEAATGEIVMFLDADTVPKVGILEAVVSALDGNDMVSLAPIFQTGSVPETMLHTSMLATLVYRFGAPGTHHDPERIIANGQCLAARREWLEGEDGISLAAANMTDDVALVRALSARGANIAFVDGAEFLVVDMHDSVEDVWHQWGRSLPMNDVTSSATRVMDLAVLWTVLVGPILRLLTGRATKLDGLLLAVRMAMNAAFLPSYCRHKLGVVLSPITDPLAVIRLTQASLRPVRAWKGRTYP